MKMGTVFLETMQKPFAGTVLQLIRGSQKRSIT